MNRLDFITDTIAHKVIDTMTGKTKEYKDDEFPIEVPGPEPLIYSCPCGCGAQIAIESTPATNKDYWQYKYEALEEFVMESYKHDQKFASSIDRLDEIEKRRQQVIEKLKSELFLAQQQLRNRRI